MLGAILAVTGLWGAISPFVLSASQGGKHAASKLMSQRLAVNVAPGVAAVLAGLALLFLAVRAGGSWRGPLLAAGGLALAAGVWFVVGPSVWTTIHTVVRTHPVTRPPQVPTVSKGRKLTVLLVDSLGPGLVVTALAGAALAGRRRPQPQPQPQPEALVLPPPPPVPTA
jgi:hypothetical protein